MPETKTRYFSLVLMLLLAACAPGATAAHPTQVGITAASTQAAATAAPTRSPARYVPPTRTPLAPFPLDGYVLVFIRDGELYFQDGNNAPIQLAHVGNPSNDPNPAEGIPWNSPLLSDDNRQVVFSRGDGNLYAINTDGTRERKAISMNWLATLKAGTSIEAVRFVPGNHQLLFETDRCGSIRADPPCSKGIFRANTDTGEITKLADSDLDGQAYGLIPRNIAVSPDGKLLAIGRTDGVEILTMDGKLIRHGILPFKPSMPDDLFPTLSWLPDSSGLIVALPDTISFPKACDTLPADSVWRYTIAGNTAVQIPLEPAPMMETFEISPDGNSVVYGGYCQPLLFFGNLVNGTTQVFGKDDSHPAFSWSPDSKHLLVARGLIVTSFGRPLIVATGDAYQWIDRNHFISNKERFLIAELSGDQVFYYDSGFEYGSGQKYQTILAIIKPK